MEMSIQVDSALETYVSPSVTVVVYKSEGILCSSLKGVQNEDFGDGGEYDL